MITALGFTGMTLFVALCGWAVARNIADRRLSILLSFPLGGLINVIAILLLTLIGLRLNFPSIAVANIVITLIFFFSIQPLLKRKIINAEQINYTNKTIRIHPMIMAICIGILSSVFLYALSHSLLPTLHYDSLTNWNMRSKISYNRSELVFDTSDGLIAKPQYPFLYHALQITAMQLQPRWNDTAANMAHLLLNLSVIGASFVLIKRSKGASIALLTTALFTGIPLMTLHLGGSYADVTMVGFALLSITLLLSYLMSEHSAYLLLSGLFAAACVWTKSDGIFFGSVPWLCVVLLALRKRFVLAQHIPVLLMPVTLAMLWPAFAVQRGLALTPHGSADTSLALSVDAVSAFGTALFSGGSFGVFWFGLFAVLLLTIVSVRTSLLPVDRRALPSLLWGLLALAGYAAVYLLTSNAEYLIIGQSFDRQMLLPAALLTVSLVWILTPASIRSEDLKGQ